MTTETASLRDVAEQVCRTEARLERLLASGWRNAATEAADLTEAAAAFDDLGLASLAERLRQVAAAANGAAALPSIALALAACRQLRVRLAADGLPAGAWTPLAPPRRSVRTQDRLIPLGRVAVGQEEVWACVRLRGPWANDYFLVDPPAAGSAAANGLEDPSGRDGRGRPSMIDEPAWLRCVLEGWLAWQTRYPLGTSGEVERCRLAGGKAVTPDDAEAQVLKVLLQTLRKPYKDGATVLGGAGGLRLRQLERAEASAYVWPDPASAAAFVAIPEDKVWALTWVEGAAIRPLVLLSPPGFFKHPALIHLVPGLPKTPLG